MMFTIDMAAMLISAAITIFVGIYAYVNRRERGARYLAWVMLFEALNACGSFLERISDTLTTKLYLFNFHQTAYIFAIPFFLFFIFDYVGIERMLRPSRTVPILLYFAIWATLLWTDSHHHLLREGIRLQDGFLMFASTEISLVLNVLGFMAMFTGLCYLGIYAGKSGPLARKQTLWVWLAVMIPIIWVMIGLIVQFPPLLWGLYTAVINGVMSVCMFMAIFRYKLFSTVPIAKDQIVEMMADEVIIVDNKGTVIDSNASARRLFAGWLESSADLAGQTIDKLLAPWPQWRNSCERMQQDEIEIEFSGKEQRSVYTVKVVPLYSAGRRKLGTASVMSDNTENRKRLEQMEQLNRLKDELFGIISHDIRDPLALLLSLTEMLDEERPHMSEESGEVLDLVREKTKNAHAMVENLLEWVRGQKDGMTLYARPIALAPIVNETVRFLESTSAAKQIDIHNEIREGILLHADREAVSLILRNLIANAVKYTPSGGVVNVGAMEQDGMVVVTVRDNGIGIEPERIGRLFGDAPVESFPGTAGERGTGIGLILCKDLVARSGGEIGVNSAPGKGSVFWFSLPRVLAG